MKKAEKETRREPLSPDACLPLGLPIGMCLGILYGSVFDKMPLGITYGCSLGLIIGVLLRSAVVKKQPPIREAFEEDFEEMAEVIRKSFMTVAEEFHITPENGGRFTAFSMREGKLLKERERGDSHFVYEKDGKIVGCFGLRFGEKEAELNHLCVLPEARHEKIGESLVFRAFTEARNREAKKILLSLVEENKRLKEWYETFGFEETETKKFDFFPFTCGYMEKKL